MSDLQARIDALTISLRPHAQASPVTARRLDTDTPLPVTGGPAGDRGSVLDGTRMSPSGKRRRRNTWSTRGTYFRPTAAHFAGNPVPATARATAPDVKRANGIRVAGDVSVKTARAIGDDNARRQWSSARGNLQRDAGDPVAERGESYPRGITRNGRLAPGARY
jgi:hypothetical protein